MIDIGQLPPPDPADLAVLRELMDGTDDEDALTFSQLPGFLFALVCAPETIPIAEWRPEVLGRDPVFGDQEQALSAHRGLVALYNEVNAGVLDGRPRLPSGYDWEADLLENFRPDSTIGAWSRGFIRGHWWLEDSWDTYVIDEMEDELVHCLFALGFFHRRDWAEEAAADEGTSLEELAEEIRLLFDPALASYADMGRSIHEALMEEEAAFTEGARLPFVAPPAIGRNDPCPCGSGRKYKRCCGRAVH